MDDQARVWVYRDGSRIYEYCAFECSDPEPGSPIRQVSWTVPTGSAIGGQLLPGAELHIRAEADPGQTMRAVMTLERMEDGSVQTEEQRVSLIEDAEESGRYEGKVHVTSDSVRILSLTAEYTNGTGSREAGQMPVNIAGVMNVQV